MGVDRPAAREAPSAPWSAPGTSPNMQRNGGGPILEAAKRTAGYAVGPDRTESGRLTRPGVAGRDNRDATV